jgi:hypothetical protein
VKVWPKPVATASPQSPAQEAEPPRASGDLEVTTASSWSCILLCAHQKAIVGAKSAPWEPGLILCDDLHQERKETMIVNPGHSM